MLNSQLLDYLEQSLAKPFTIVCIVELGEANESTLELSVPPRCIQMGLLHWQMLLLIASL